MARAGEWEDEGAREGMEVAVSTLAPSSPTLEDEPLSKSPDPSSKPIFSPLGSLEQTETKPKICTVKGIKHPTPNLSHYP